MLLEYDEVKMYVVIYLYKCGYMTVTHRKMFHFTSNHTMIALSTAVKNMSYVSLKTYTDREFFVENGFSHR